jgi:hypothetical protein
MKFQVVWQKERGWEETSKSQESKKPLRRGSIRFLVRIGRPLVCFLVCTGWFGLISHAKAQRRQGKQANNLFFLEIPCIALHRVAWICIGLRRLPLAFWSAPVFWRFGNGREIRKRQETAAAQNVSAFSMRWGV